MAHTQDRAELKKRLYREINHVRTGMLGLAGEPIRHLQPMTAFCEEEGGPIWFFAREDSDIAREAGAAHAAMFCLMTKDHDFIACVSGSLGVDSDPGKVDRYWNPVVAAWFPEGKDDPTLCLLKFEPDDAEVWISHANPIRFGFEIAKANMTKSLPNMGGKEHLPL